jgi:hypothetical protein
MAARRPIKLAAIKPATIAKATRTLFSLDKDRSALMIYLIPQTPPHLGLIASHRRHRQAPAFGQAAAKDGAVVILFGGVDLAPPSVEHRPAQSQLFRELGEHAKADMVQPVRG